MKIMTIHGVARAFLLLAISTATTAPAWAETNFYVDPANGNDQASGTSPSVPFRTLARAQAAVRSVVAPMTDDVVVNLRGGTYSLTAPLLLTTADSGRNGRTVIWKAYAGETPVVTSARRIVGWRAVGNGQYRAPVGTFNFRQMFVNGVRATRARFPEVGSWGQLVSQDRTARTLSVSAPLVGNWQKFTQVEMNLLLQWGESYLRLGGATPNGPTTSLTFQKTESDILFERPYPILANGSPLYFENAREFLTNPGEFYVDTVEGAVYYLPRDGEAMGTASTIAPTLETLIDIRGTGLDTPAHDIRISGISFADTTWLYASRNGMLNAQGGNYNLTANMRNEQTVGRPPAAVRAALADRIQIDGNVFTRTGATALDLANGVHDSAVVGNLIYDISGNGIMVGKFSDPDVEYHSVYNPPASPAGEDVREVTRNVDVLNNVITRVGEDYYGVAGINAGFVNTVNIRNNEISDGPWAGISLGWGWQTQANALGNNHVERNEISNVLTKLCDTAGVYHLSNDPGTTIDYNYIHDVRRMPSHCGSWVGGFYLDEGTSNLSLSNNVVQAADDGVAVFNRNGPGNRVENNVGQGAATIQAAGVQAGYRSLRNRLNLAFNRPASSSSIFSGGTGAAAANDGNVGSGWSPLGNDTAAWWQVDLGKAYQLSQFTIVTRQDLDQPETRTSFEVQASNDPGFATYTVIGRKDVKTDIPFAGTMTRKVVDQGAYRYVRIAKTDGKYFFIADVSIHAGGGETVTYPAPPFDPNRFYKIKNVGSGKVLSVSGGSKASMTGLIQWDDTGAEDQQFRIVRTSGNLFQIVARHSGMALDVNDASGRTGARIIQYPFENTNHELWYFQPGPNGSWVIRNFRSDQAMEVGGASADRGATVNQWFYNSQDNQRWTIE